MELSDIEISQRIKTFSFQKLTVNRNRCHSWILLQVLFKALYLGPS